MSSDLAALSGRRVLVTGHTGFKGSWLALWLSELGARVWGYALDPPTEPSHFEVTRIHDRLEADLRADVRDPAALDQALELSQADVIFHLAAQSIVREGYRTPLQTFEVNSLGTAHVLEAVRRRGRPTVVVCVTSDKCYEPTPDAHAHSESDPLGGFDPYSASKGAAEVVISSYRRSFFPGHTIETHGVRVASARAGNVIGGGDWSADRIVVDVVEALRLGKPVELRHPGAIRPWQHVLEPLNGYLTLAAQLCTDPRPELCDAFNFGPRADDERTVRELVELFHRTWQAGTAVCPAKDGAPHESPVLRLAIDRASERLGWSPRWTLVDAVRHTADWYRLFLDGEEDLGRVSLRQIHAYPENG